VTAIYEGGNYLAITVAELLNNEVAVRQLINSHNAANRSNETLVIQLADARDARLRPSIAISLAVMGAGGATLIGLGTNYFASQNPPPAAAIIFGLGVVLTLFASLTPVVLSYSSRSRTNR